MRKHCFGRISAFVLSFLMIMGAALGVMPSAVKAAGEPTFTVTADKQELHRGDQFTVTVSMADNEDACGITYAVNYNPEQVAVVDTQKGTVIEDVGSLAMVWHNEDRHLVQATVPSLEVIPNGTLMGITFKVLEDVSAGDLNFTYNIMVTDGEATPIEYTNNVQIDLSVVVPVTDISLNKTSTTIARGGTEQLSATVEPSDAASTVIWSSDNENVAKVDDSGLVTAVGKGTANITAMAGSQSASCQVTVNAPLQGIEITGELTTIKKGTTTQLNVVYDPADTTDDTTVTWSSDNESVAKIDQNGLVTAVADGSATIKATVGGLEDTYEITVQEVKLDSIEIKESTTIHCGETETLEVTYNPNTTTDDRSVNWTSSDPTIATVDGSGTVAAVKPGQTVITAIVGNHMDTCTVTVDAPLKQIIPNENTVDLVKNQSATISYSLDPNDTTDRKTVTFTSSNPDVAQVDNNTGKVTAVSAGNAKITLTGANNVTAEVTVIVTEIPIDTVLLDKYNAVVEKGQTIGLTAAVSPEDNTDDNQTINWSSSDESVATVSAEETNAGEKVTVTATEKGGTATITATAWNGTEASCTITVPTYIESIALPENVTLNRGQTTVLDLICTPETYDDTLTVIWSSDNPDIASIDSQSGMISGVKRGNGNDHCIGNGNKTYR